MNYFRVRRFSVSLSLFLVFSLSVCRLPADIDVNALLIFFGVFCVIIRLCMHGLIGYWLDAFFNTLIEIWQECIIGVNINIFCYNFLYTRINTNHDSLHACGRFFFPLAERIVGIFLHHHPPVLHRIAKLVYKCWESKW